MADQASDFEQLRRLLGPDLGDQLERLDELSALAYDDETDELRAERDELSGDVAIGLLVLWRRLLREAPESVNGGG